MEKGCSILGILELELGELVASMEIGWGFRVQPKASVSKFDLGGPHEGEKNSRKSYLYVVLTL